MADMIQQQQQVIRALQREVEKLRDELSEAYDRLDHKHLAYDKACKQRDRAVAELRDARIVVTAIVRAAGGEVRVPITTLTETDGVLERFRDVEHDVEVFRARPLVGEIDR